MPAVMNLTNACDTAFKISFHPIYRISQFYQLIALILAVFPLTLIIYKVKKSRFHGNLKWLLCGYFGLILIFTFVYGFLSSAQVVIPFIAKTPCDLLLDPINYQIGNGVGCFFMTVPIFFPISITCERFWATREARVYEKTRVVGGPVITFLLIFLDFAIMVFIFKDSNVALGSYSFINIPEPVAQKMYIFYIVIFAVNSLNFLLSIYLIFKNRHLTKINTTLSVKYQLREVYMSTKFANLVIFVHVAFFGIYIAGTITSKYWGSRLFENTIDLAVFRGVWMTTIATYTFLIGTVAVYFFNKMKRKTTAAATSMVRMASRGAAGARNYNNAISTAWTTVTA